MSHTSPSRSASPSAMEHPPQDMQLGMHTEDNDADREKRPNGADKAFPSFAGDLPWSQRSWLYELMPFRGMYYDFRRRLPFLATDWTTAFSPRNWWTVGQYVPRMYFINLMPAISYIIDMNHRTGGAYGLNEVILASALAAIVFPVFSIQPLTFVGVTGLINLVNYTQYNIVVQYYGLDRMGFLRVQAWSLIWAAGFHFLVSVFNICDFTRFITDMTSQTFGFYVGIVYIQKGIELLLLEFEPLPLDNATGWLSVTIAILFTVSVYLVTAIGKTSFLPFKIRYFISSFAFAAGCIFWTGFSHFPKNSLKRVPIERLPITRSFFPTIDRPWFIDFWNIEARWAFVGAPLGFLIMILFYFDHNVSSVMAQARQFPVRRPAGFHWDFFLLGITTLVSGFLGLPAPNGLVPQCPWSTDALSVYKQVEKPTNDEEGNPLMGVNQPKYPRHHIINSRVVENRVGHLIVGLLTLGTMTRPLLVVLGTMPRALFAGIFILVGWSSIEGNTITIRTLAIFKDRHLGDANDGLSKLRRSKISLFVGIQWIFFALTIAISQTIAAIGFPVIITLLIPFRYYIVPKWFTPAELRILDAPTADADVVLASIGQETEAVTGEGQKVARDTGIAGTEWKDDEDDDEDDKYDSARRQGRGDSRINEKQYARDKEDSEVQGYVIKGDSDEGDDVVVRPSDSIAHMTDHGGVDPSGMAGPSLATPFAAGVPSTLSVADTAAAPAAASGTQIVSPQKNNKRSKSATQGWWGLGMSKPVERAPTPQPPVTSVTSETATEPVPVVDTPEALEDGEEKKGESGIKRLFSSKGKRKSTVPPPAQETAAFVAQTDKEVGVKQHFTSHKKATAKAEDHVAEPVPSAAGGMLGQAPHPEAAAQLQREILAVPAASAAETVTTTSSPRADVAPAGDGQKKVLPVVGDTFYGPAIVMGLSETVLASDKDDEAKRKAEKAAAGAAAAAETRRIAEEQKQRAEEEKRKAKEAKELEKKKKVDEKQKAKDEKEASKRREKEEVKRKKEEAALLKQQKKDEKERRRLEDVKGDIKKSEKDKKVKEAALAAVVARIASAEKDEDNVKQATEKEQERLQSLETEEKKHLKDKKEAEAAVASLAQEKKHLEEQMAETRRLNEEAEAKENKAKAIEKEREETRKQEEATLAAVVADRQTNEKTLTILEQKQQALQKENREARAKAEEAVGKLQQEKEALKEENEDAKVLREEMEQSRLNSEAELAQLATKKEALEAEHERKRREEEAALAALIASRETALKKLTNTKNNNEKEVAELQESKAEREKDLADLDKKHKSLEKETEVSKKKAEKEVAKLQEEKEVLERKIAETKKREEAGLALLVSKGKSIEKENVERKKKEEAEFAAKEAKKQALEREIEELEAKASSARLFLAPAKVPKSSLTALSGQVAGHEAGVSTIADGAFVVKSCSESESSFYQNVLIHQTADTRKSQTALLLRLKKYLPTYHGTIEIDAGNNSDEGGLAVILENLTREYKHANVLDIKLGKQLWDDAASAEKRKRMDEAARSSTSAETGLRLTGWQIWNKERGDYIKVGKTFGKTIKADQIPLGLRSFFGVASEQDAAKVSEITGDSITATILPEKAIERILHDGVLASIKEIIDIVKKLEWRVRGSSILIVYEGDQEVLNKVDGKSDLQAGRRLTNVDQLVDTHNLEGIKSRDAQRGRIVDVRLIDFAHVSIGIGKEKHADAGYLAGLESTKHHLEDLSKALHKGAIKADQTSSDNVVKSAGGVLLGSLARGLFHREKVEFTEKSPGGRDDVAASKEWTKLEEPKAVSNPVASEAKQAPSASVNDVEATGAVAPTIVSHKVAEGKSKGFDKEAASKTKEDEVKRKPSQRFSIFGGSKKQEEPAVIEQEEQRAAKEEEQKRASAAMAAETKEKEAKDAKDKDKEREKGSGGFMSLFHTKLTDEHDKRKVNDESPAEPLAKKEQNNDISGDTTPSTTEMGKGKTKGKGRVVDTTPSAPTEAVKTDTFWSTAELPTKAEQLVAPSSKSTGPRKLIRHENPRRGAGKAPPAIQFRNPGEL